MNVIKEKDLVRLQMDCEWRAFEKKLVAASEKCSVKRVHSLRIATRKIEAVIFLFRPFVKNRHAKKLLVTIEKVRKMLGPLRNADVELQKLEKKKDRNLISLIHFVKKRRTKFRKRALKNLKGLSLTKEREWYREFVDRVVNANSARADFIVRIKNEVKKRHAMVVSRYRFVLAKSVNPPVVHKYRIEFKRVRYQAEFLKSVGAADLNTRRFSNIQKTTGEIQNRFAMLKCVDRYLEKNRSRAVTAAEKLRTELCF